MQRNAVEWSEVNKEWSTRDNSRPLRSLDAEEAGHWTSVKRHGQDAAVDFITGPGQLNVIGYQREIVSVQFARPRYVVHV